MLSPLGTNVALARISRTDVPGALAHIDSVWKQLVPKVPLRRQFLDDLFNAAYETYSTVGRVLTGLAGFAFVIAVMGLIRHGDSRHRVADAGRSASAKPSARPREVWC